MPRLRMGREKNNFLVVRKQRRLPGAREKNRGRNESHGSATFPCGLRSPVDLCCPGYNPRQHLAKDSNLARAAARYKIDIAKLGTHVRWELAKKSAKEASPKSESKSHK